MEKILKKEFIVPMVVIVICMFLCVISKKIIYRIFNLKTAKTNLAKKRTIANLINNIIKFSIVLLGILIVLETYGIDTKSLVASLGVVGIVIGLALQDLLKDFIVGISIIFEGEYLVGDYVCINDFKGEVLPSNLRTTKIKAYTGEVKIIYNRNITEIINYSKGSTNLIVDIDVSYDSDIKKVKEILDDLCIKLKSDYKLNDISCLGIEQLASSSIKFRIVALSNYSEQFALGRNIRKEIVLTFNENNITIPYNQVVVHNG